MSHNDDPFALLAEIERRARQSAVGLPHTEEVQTVFTGVGFRLDTVLLAVPLDEVHEILTYPTVTRVPGVRPWVKGIANVRGVLLPIVDLAGCLGGSHGEHGMKNRVLTIRYGDTYVGLMVTEVLGAKRFLDEERSAIPELREQWLLPYLQDEFTRNGEHWSIFSMAALGEGGLLSRAAL